MYLKIGPPNISENNQKCSPKLIPKHIRQLPKVQPQIDSTLALRLLALSLSLSLSLSLFFLSLFLSLTGRPAKPAGRRAKRALDGLFVFKNTNTEFVRIARVSAMIFNNL